jgi:hypothetical protein
MSSIFERLEFIFKKPEENLLIISVLGINEWLKIKDNNKQAILKS